MREGEVGLKISVIAGALILASAPFVLSACQTTKDSPKLSDIKVDYDFENIHGFSSVSPAFNVTIFLMAQNS
jgi:hypothetical protein